jgi:hypothetical protein
MSYAAPLPSTSATSKVARLTNVVRRSWSQARLTDRQLMELRTNLTRHSG